MIDPATGWFEIKEMKDSNNSADVSRFLTILGSVDIHDPDGL